MNEKSLNLGNLTRSLAYSINQDYMSLLLNFKDSSNRSTHLTEGDDYKRKKELMAWAKDKSSIVSQFRNLLRIPYDSNHYETIEVINRKMFERRSQITFWVDQLRELAQSLEGLKVPIYAIEEALYFMRNGKK